tara:strand:- start:1920 stop:2189 length:270 start_codon:yes stop_codon:yes gene_type:complete
MLPLEIEELIMKYRGNIQPPHFFIYNHYLKIQELNEEIREIERYFEMKEDEMFNTWYCGDGNYDIGGNYFSFPNHNYSGNWDTAGNYVE